MAGGLDFLNVSERKSNEMLNFGSSIHMRRLNRMSVNSSTSNRGSAGLAGVPGNPVTLGNSQEGVNMNVTNYLTGGYSSALQHMFNRKSNRQSRELVSNKTND